MVNQMPDGKLVLRLLDADGEFIAQCTVTPWQKVATPMKLDDFEKMMRASAGWQQKEGPALEASDKLKSASGYGILRITAEGKLGSVDALRRFYLVAAPTGDQILVDFTMIPSQAAKLDGRDERIVQSLLFVEAGRIGPVPAVKTRPRSIARSAQRHRPGCDRQHPVRDSIHVPDTAIEGRSSIGFTVATGSMPRLRVWANDRRMIREYPHRGLRDASPLCFSRSSFSAALRPATRRGRAADGAGEHLLDRRP